MDFPNLKGRYQFRISVPSFIFPAGYTENVGRLGAYIDEIELLLLESTAEALPSVNEIEELAQLAVAQKVGYNVHLPIDVDPCTADRQKRQSSIERIAAALTRATALHPTTYTLHLPFAGDRQSGSAKKMWRAYALESLDRLLSLTGTEPHKLSIETLDYPPHWLEPILARVPCAVCVDVGHVLNNGFDLQSVLNNLGHRATIVHLHGAADGCDHLAIDHITPAAWAVLHPFLTQFHGSLSLELFDPQRLQTSMATLERRMGYRV